MESFIDNIPSDIQTISHISKKSVRLKYGIFFFLYTICLSVASIWIYKYIFPNNVNSSIPLSTQLKSTILPTPISDFQAQSNNDELAKVKQLFTDDVLEKNLSLKTKFVAAKFNNIIKARNDTRNPFYIVHVGADTGADNVIYAVTEKYAKIIAVSSDSVPLTAEVFYDRAVLEMTSGQNISSFVLINRDTGDTLKFSDPHALLSADPKFSTIRQQIIAKGIFEGEFFSNFTLFGNQIYFFQGCGYCLDGNGRNNYFSFIINAQTGELTAIEPYTTDQKY